MHLEPGHRIGEGAALYEGALGAWCQLWVQKTRLQDERLTDPLDVLPGHRQPAQG